MKKIMYSLMLCVIVFAFASCGAEDLLGEKAIKFTLNGKSYEFKGNLASDTVGPVAVLAGDSLTISAGKDGDSTRNNISFLATSQQNGSWAASKFKLEVTIDGTLYGASDVSLASLKVTGSLPVKVLTATFNNIDVIDSSSPLNTKKITGGKIEVRYGNSSDLGL